MLFKKICAVAVLSLGAIASAQAADKMYDFKFQFVESNKAKVETINLKDGIYFFILKLSDGSIVNKKVTIIH